MRVAIINLHCGGMLHYTGGIANSICHDHDVAVFCPSRIPARIFDPAVNVFSFEVPQSLSLAGIPAVMRSLHTIKRIRRAVIQWNPDVVHVNSGHPWQNWILPDLAALFPVVATIHDVNPHLGGNRLWQSLKQHPLLRYSAAIIVHTKELKHAAMAKWHLPADKVHVMPICEFNAFAPWAEGIEEEPHTILLFGRIRRYKGTKTALHALSLVKSRIPQARMVIAGEGDLAPYAALIDQNKDSLIIRNAFLNEQESATLFEQAAVVILPYLEASQSAVPGVAASFAKPVIASRVGGIPSLIEHEHTGLLVQPGREQELADAIVALLNDPQKRHELGRNAEDRFRKYNGPEVIATHLSDIYVELLD